MGGGSYAIRIDAGDELIVSAGGGLRWLAGQRWAPEVVSRGDQHFADWDLVDEVGGGTASIGDYFVRGVSVGLRYRF